jgi:RHS repeat-associated protein
VVDYLRDTQARIKEVGIKPPGVARTVLLNNATYEPFGPVVGWTYGNGRTLSRSYDLDYRPKTIFDPASGGLSLGYGYNTVGDLTELKDGFQGAFKAKYDYDTVGRLTVTRDGTSSDALETYEYDPTGNRKKLLHGLTTTDIYDIPTDSHRLRSVGGISRSYDAVGNTIAIGGTAKEFVYNANDRMKQVKQGGLVKMGYRYNAKGERVAAITGDTGSVTTYTLYDEAGHWVGDYDSNGTAVQQAVWMSDAPVGLLVGAGATTSLKYVQPDHLGTPRSVIDPARNVAIWTWDAKSEVFGDTPPSQDPDLDGTSLVFNMRYPGQRYDPTTGLNYNYYRDYDPITGRFIQSDPIGLEGGISTYAYVDGTPLTMTDPIGLSSVFFARPLPTSLNTIPRPTPAPLNATPRPIPPEYQFLEPKAGETATQYQRRMSDHRINEARNWKNESPYTPKPRSTGPKAEETGFGLLGRLLKNLKDIADDISGFGGTASCPVIPEDLPMTESEFAECISQGYCA